MYGTQWQGEKLFSVPLGPSAAMTTLPVLYGLNPVVGLSSYSISPLRPLLRLPPAAAIGQSPDTRLTGQPPAAPIPCAVPCVSDFCATRSRPAIKLRAVSRCSTPCAAAPCAGLFSCPVCLHGPCVSTVCLVRPWPLNRPRGEGQKTHEERSPAKQRRSSSCEQPRARQIPSSPDSQRPRYPETGTP